MPYQSINANDGKLLKSFEHISSARLDEVLAAAEDCFQTWKHKRYAERAANIATNTSHIDVLAFEGGCSAKHGQGAPPMRPFAHAISAVLQAAPANARVRRIHALGACTDHLFHAQSRH
jgi:hypothetical protein